MVPRQRPIATEHLRNLGKRFEAKPVAGDSRYCCRSERDGSPGVARDTVTYKPLPPARIKVLFLAENARPILIHQPLVYKGVGV